MPRKSWVNVALTIVVTITGVVVPTWGLAEGTPAACSIFGLDGQQTTVLLVCASLLGWGFLALAQLIPGLRAIRQSGLDKRVLTEDSVMREVVAAKRVRIFASGSQTAQRALLPYVTTIAHNMVIDVLVRTDGSSARQANIKVEADRWRRDVARANIKLNIRAYRFEPVMIRGWIVDDKTAFTGWYYREGDVTTGQTDPVFRIADSQYVAGVSALFDKMFASATPL